MLTNWKTNLAGLVTLLSGLGNFFTHLSMDISTGMFDMTILMTDITAIAGGIGLIFAKDFNVTGGTREQ